MRVILIILLIIGLKLQAQTVTHNFKDLDGLVDILGKKLTKSEVYTNPYMFYNTADSSLLQFKNDRIDMYFSTEFGVLGFVFNKKDICIAVLVAKESKHKFIVSNEYTVKKLEDCNITVISKL